MRPGYTSGHKVSTDLLITAIGAFAASAIVTGAVRGWAMRRQILDHPTDRGSHDAPTPRGGGIAIVVVTLIGLLLLERARLAAILPYCATALAIAVVGFVDDVKQTSMLGRFAFQTLLAAAAVIVYGAFDQVALTSTTIVSFGLAASALTTIWIVGLTDSFNFMDGINGITGGQALVAGIGWAAIGAQRGDPTLTHLGLLIAAASLGFLLYNWGNARIFMGDVGSTFLGYTFAVAGLIAAADSRDALIPALLVWPFLFDTGLTFIRRLRSRQNVFIAHRTHLYQRLVIGGWTHAEVATLYVALATGGAVAAIGLERGAIERGPVVALVAICAVALLLLTASVERRARLRAAT